MSKKKKNPSEVSPFVIQNEKTKLDEDMKRFDKNMPDSVRKRWEQLLKEEKEKKNK